jgi:hypothetical protein
MQSIVLQWHSPILGKPLEVEFHPKAWKTAFQEWKTLNNHGIKTKIGFCYE